LPRREAAEIAMKWPRVVRVIPKREEVAWHPQHVRLFFALVTTRRFLAVLSAIDVSRI